MRNGFWLFSTGVREGHQVTDNARVVQRHEHRGGVDAAAETNDQQASIQG